MIAAVGGLAGAGDAHPKGEDSGMEDLYRLFARGIRFYLCRQLGNKSWTIKFTTLFSSWCRPFAAAICGNRIV